MIQFFIKNRELLLPDDFSFTWNEQNPEITTNGEFSLDMTVSLLEAQNAIAFEFLNRLNKSTITKTADARLIIDGVVHIGTIIITKNTDIEVTFQFIAGYSEFKYIAKNEKKIWEIAGVNNEGWGIESAIDFNRSVLSIAQTGYIWKITSGANLVRNSKFLALSYLPPYEEVYRLVALEAGKTYTFSITGIASQSGGGYESEVGAVIKNSDSTVTILVSTMYSFPSSAFENTHTVTFISPVTDSNCKITVWRNSSPVILKTLKVELGSVGSDWCPHASEVCNFVCAPIKVGEELVNDFEFNVASSGEYTENWFKFDHVTGKTIMQPYLLYYINKLPALLGYSLKYNVLNEDVRAKVMYLVNATDSLNYADALPDMTVTEFIEAIENFFNVTFLIDPKDRSLSIHSFQTNMSLKKTIKIQNALDDYERGFEPDTKPVKFGFTKISYDLPGSVYFKYQKLSDAIISKCELLQFASFDQLFNYVTYNQLIDKYKIYRDLDKNEDYISCVEPTLNLFNQKIDDNRHITLVNKFGDVGNSTDMELVLKIVPAQIDYATKVLYYADHENMTGHYQLPKSSNYYSIINDLGLKDSIENGLKEIARISKLEVSLFMGLVEFVDAMIMTPYPFSYSDINPEFGKAPTMTYTVFEDWRFHKYRPKAITTLKIIGENGILSDYHQTSIIDMSKPYTFIFPDDPDVSSNNIFEINNLKYMPISLERKKSNKKNLVQGKFYRMFNQ